MARPRMRSPSILRAAASLMAVSLVLFGPALPARASFPGANGAIVFFAFDGTKFQAQRMNPDGSNLKAIGGGPDLTWSPDGTLIGFSYHHPRSSGIAVMRPNGHHVAVLTQQTNGGFDEMGSWSPDGTKIVFLRCHGAPGCAIFTMNADGSNQVQVTSVDAVARTGSSGPRHGRPTARRSRSTWRGPSG